MDAALLVELPGGQSILRCYLRILDKSLSSDGCAIARSERSRTSQRSSLPRFIELMLKQTSLNPVELDVRTGRRNSGGFAWLGRAAWAE